MTLEIHKMLVLSSAHVTEETARTLGVTHKPSMLPYRPAFTRAEGWILYVGGNNGDPLPEMYKFAPFDLKRVVEFAHDQKVEWLMLDADGHSVDLPIYDW